MQSAVHNPITKGRKQFSFNFVDDKNFPCSEPCLLFYNSFICKLTNLNIDGTKAHHLHNKKKQVDFSSAPPTVKY